MDEKGHQNRVEPWDGESKEPRAAENPTRRAKLKGGLPKGELKTLGFQENLFTEATTGNRAHPPQIQAGGNPFTEPSGGKVEEHMGPVSAPRDGG